MSSEGTLKRNFWFKLLVSDGWENSDLLKSGQTLPELFHKSGPESNKNRGYC